MKVACTVWGGGKVGDNFKDLPIVKSVYPERIYTSQGWHTLFGQPDNNGYSQMTKLRIARAGVDKNGDARRYPWCITAENGVGIAQHTKVGGTYCKSGSYQSIRKAFINLSDYDFFRLINRTVRYIAQFENTYCPPIIGDGRNAYGQMLMQRQMANNPTQY